MCTAMKIGGIFGRTLDLEHTYNEQIVICPRSFVLKWRHLPALAQHYAILGMATVAEGFPLYYDAVNEHGLAMAALNFPHSGAYVTATEGDVTAFELIPYVLSQCTDIPTAKKLLEQTQVCDTAFSPDYPTTRLHWMVADTTASLVVESTVDGLQVYHNPVEVMTNEPPFPQQMKHREAYLQATPDEPADTQPHLGRGSGSLGLPGDFTSPSRFVRAAFIAAHSEVGEDAVGSFFHAMATLELPRGCLRLPNGDRVVSQYTCGMDLAQPVYYCRTCGIHRLTAVRLADPEGDALVTYPLPSCDYIARHN